jgi:hypothetical protein
VFRGTQSAALPDRTRREPQPSASNLATGGELLAVLINGGAVHRSPQHWLTNRQDPAQYRSVPLEKAEHLWTF